MDAKGSAMVTKLDWLKEQLPGWKIVRVDWEQGSPQGLVGLSAWHAEHPQKLRASAFAIDFDECDERQVKSMLEGYEHDEEWSI
jgi:hypothetical protein